jgi:hypothetical protein
MDYHQKQNLFLYGLRYCCFFPLLSCWFGVFICCVASLFLSWCFICLYWEVGAAIWWYYILGYHFSCLYTSFVSFLLMNMCIKYFFYAEKLFCMLVCFLISTVLDTFLYYLCLIHEVNIRSYLYCCAFLA